jgi:membrane protease YdiL (CAAX protease family)
VVKRSTSAPSPLSPIAWLPDGFVWWRSLTCALLVAFALLVGMVLLVLWVSLSGKKPEATDLNWNLIVAQCLFYVPVVSALFAALPWAARGSLAELGLRVPTGAETAAGLAGGGAMFVVTIALGALQTTLVHVVPKETVVQALGRTHNGPLLVGFAFLACVLAPFAEELVFRGLLLNALWRYLPFWPAAVLAGLGFAAAHGEVSAIVPLWGGGVVLAYVYARTRALTASMLAHGTFNAINVLLIVLFHQTS